MGSGSVESDIKSELEDFVVIVEEIQDRYVADWLIIDVFAVAVLVFRTDPSVDFWIRFLHGDVYRYRFRERFGSSL